MTHPAGLYRAVDFSGFASVIRLKVGAGPNIDITAPDALFNDPRAALNGRGSSTANCLLRQIIDGWTGAGAIDVGFDDDGFFYFESDTESYALTDGALSGILVALGFDGDVPLIAGGAPFRATAARQPVPGAFRGGAGLSMNPSVSASYAVGVGRWYPTPITALRERGALGDLDDVADSLEAAIHAADPSLADIAIGIDDDGQITAAWPSTLALAWTWLDTSFRDELGYRGDEGIVSDGSVDTYTAGRMFRAVQVAPEGLRQLDRYPVRVADKHGRRDGLAAVAKRGKFHVVDVELDLDGVDTDRDDVEHFLERVIPYEGELLSVEPIWGEPRRAMKPYDATVSRPAHSFFETTRAICMGDPDDGRGGRVVGQLAGDNAESVRPRWLAGEGLRLGARLELTIEDVGEVI